MTWNFEATIEEGDLRSGLKNVMITSSHIYNCVAWLLTLGLLYIYT
jgi:hypothetical protein